MATKLEENNILQQLAAESQMRDEIIDDDDDGVDMPAVHPFSRGRIIESARPAGEPRATEAFVNGDDDDEQPVRQAPVVRRPVGRPRKNPLPEPVQSDVYDEDEMGRRRRQKNAMSANGQKPKRAAFEGVPATEIRAAMDLGIEHVVVKLSQRNDRGHVGHVGMFPMPLAQLLDIEEWLKNEHGGGAFMIEPRDADNAGAGVGDIPTFDVKIMAPVRVRTGGGQQMPSNNPFGGPPFGGVPGMPPSPPPFGQAYVDPKFLPPFVRHMDQAAQVDWAQRQGVPVTTATPPGYQQPVMLNTPDELMRVELERAQNQMERERQEARARESAHRRELDLRQAKLDETIKSLENERRAAEQRATEARFQQIQEQNRMQVELLMSKLNDKEKTPPPKAFDLAGVAAVIGAVAPALVAMVESSRSQAQRAVELQSNSMTEMLRATVIRAEQNPTLDLLTKLAPVVMPLALKYFESKSPAAQAELVASLSENNMTAIGMMVKLVSEMGGGDGESPPWWMPMINETLGAVMKTAESLSASNKRSVGLPAGPSPAMTLPRQTPAQAAAQEPAAPPAATAPDQLTGLQIAEMVWQSPHLPEDIRNSEGWFKLVVRLHEHAPVQEVAQMFVDHIRMLDPDPATGKKGPGLPAVMTGFWDSVNSERIMRTVFGALPFASQQPEYLTAFIAASFELLDEDNPVNAVS